MSTKYKITELGKREIRDPESIYFKNISKDTLTKMKYVIDEVLKKGN